MSHVESTDHQRLADAARAARPRSHAPFSKFRAGAAALTDGGDIVPGVIVENVSLGLAMCAERVAMFSTVAAGQRPVAVALAAPDTRKDRTWPCGACLQVALELGGPEMQIIVTGTADGSDTQSAPVRDLLPRSPYIDA
jgi:cytidine deaminase